MAWHLGLLARASDERRSPVTCHRAAKWDSVLNLLQRSVAHDSYPAVRDGETAGHRGCSILRAFLRPGSRQGLVGPGEHALILDRL